MSDPFERICLLLATAEIRDREIEEFLSRVQIYGVSTTRRYISSLRQFSIPHAIEMADYPSHRSSSRSFENDGLAEKILRLLIGDAGLTRSQAIEILNSEIDFRHPGLSIPRDSRKGFHSWISRLIEIVPESELLHIATQIRNRFVHDGESDWKLK